MLPPLADATAPPPRTYDGATTNAGSPLVTRYDELDEGRDPRLDDPRTELDAESSNPSSLERVELLLELLELLLELLESSPRTADDARSSNCARTVAGGIPAESAPQTSASPRREILLVMAPPRASARRDPCASF